MNSYITIIAFGIVPAAMVLTLALMLIVQKLLAKSSSEFEARFHEHYEQNKTQLDVRLNEAPPAWIAAQTLLQEYFTNNVLQVKMIFWFSVFVMLVGFGIICGGMLQIEFGRPSWESALPTVAGVLTEFIGGTFLLMYRSANQQAALYLKSLDNMNNVGMAVCVARYLSDESAERSLKAETFSKLAQEILNEATKTFSNITLDSESPSMRTDGTSTSPR